MTDEMFAQLLNMVQSAGEGGMILAILYMLLAPLGWIISAGSVVYIARLIVFAISRGIEKDDMYKQIARTAGYNITEFTTQVELERYHRNILRYVTTGKEKS